MRRTVAMVEAIEAAARRDLLDDLRRVWKQHAGSNDVSTYMLSLEAVLQGLVDVEGST